MFTWTIGGATIELVDPYIIRAISGLGGPPAKVQLVKAPYQDGKTRVDTVTEERYIMIDLLIASLTYDDKLAASRTLSGLFNPKLGEGVFTWEQEGRTFSIDACAEKGIEFIDNPDSYLTQRALVYLVAPFPYWYDPIPESWTVASFSGGFELPLELPLTVGTIGQTFVAENRGDVNTPVFISFRGPVSNPVIENLTTGEKIQITRQILAGETLEINTAFGSKSIIIEDALGTRSNAFHYVSDDTELWQLIPGENEISYAATEEAGDAAVTLRYYHRYSGC